MNNQDQPRQQALEQKRAKQAWQDVNGVSESAQGKYGTIARKFPTLVQTNGLGMTLAFLRAKDDAGMTLLYGHISNWVTARMGEDGDLLEAITRWSSDGYRRATSETLAYALWLRRFAEAKGMVDESGEN